MAQRPLSEKFEFQNADGHTLSGRLDVPAVGKPLAYAVFAHCFSCSKDLAASRTVVAALTAEGIGVLRFDFTGLGNSAGDFANSHFRANVQDLQAALKAMANDGRPVSLLVGHSLGGAAVLQAAALEDGIKAVATVGAPYDPAHALDRLEGDLETIRSKGHGTVEIAGRVFDISAEFLAGMEAEALKDRLKRLNAALLVCHSPVDQTVSIDQASSIFQAARHPKSFLSLDKADHLLTQVEDATFVGHQIATWAKRYIPLIEPNQSDLSGQIIVRSTGLGKFQQEVLGDGHCLTADEPKSFGGNATGFSPYEFLMTALGACTNMTIKMYADRKGLAVEQVETSLDHAKIHVSDCEDCTTEKGKIDEIKRQIKITAPTLTQEQLARLMEITDMCPVHRTLHSEVKIRTTQA